MTRAGTLKQVPQVPLSDNPALNDFLNAIKQCLEVYQGNIGDGSDVIARRELSDFENQNADWESTDGGDEVYNKPALGTAASRDTEDTMTDGAKLPDGHAIKEYGDTNWGTGELDNFRIGDETIEGSLWNIIGLDNDNEKNLTIYDLVNEMPWISAYRHGGVFLYYDGNRRFETTIDGVTITGDLNVTGGWTIDDFEIGTYTIDAGSWNAIKVSGERNFTLYNSQDSEPFISCYRNEGVFLYYNGVRILETATEGIKLSNSDQSIVATIGPQTIEAATWQGFNIAGGANFCVYDADNTNSMIGAYRAAGVFLYYAGNKKFETTTNGTGITGYTDLTNLGVTTRVGPQTLDAATWQAISITGAANFSIYDLDNSNAMIGAYRAAGVFLYYNGTKKFETTSSGVEVAGQIKITGGVPGASKVLTSDAAGLATWETPGAGSGDVVGPGSATDNAICRFHLATGKIIQNSSVVIADTGALSIGDGEMIILGASNDMRFGNHVVGGGTFNSITLYGSDNFSIYDATNTNAMIGAYRNAGVFLYYSGNAKLETTNTGITVTGSCSGCDYVFEDDYDLMSLDALHNHIKDKRALPNMTINTGTKIDLNNLRKESVEKIEELFIYVLQLHNRTKILEKVM